MTFIEHTEGWGRGLQRSEFGDEQDPQIREFLRKTAPLNSAQKVKSPLMIIQGLNDPRVPANQSEEIVRAVKKNGTPVWYLLAKDEGHGFALANNRDFSLYSTILFTEKFLIK